MATSLKELIVTFQANAKPVLNALNQVDSKLKQTSRSLRATGESFSRMGRELGLVVSLPLAAMGAASIKAAADVQSLEASLTSILAKFNKEGNIDDAIASEMQFLKETAEELGVSLQSIQKPYVQYLASSKDSLEVTRKTAKSFLGLSTALGLPAAQTQLIIKALQQMQSKGTVMAEELRLQLGDSVPGAVDLFAEAMGVGTKEFLKLMEQGKVSSKVLQDVAAVIDKKYGAAIQKGSRNIRASTNRISNAFFLLRVNVGRGLDETFKVNEKMAAFAEWLTKVANNFARLDAKGKKVILTIGLFLAIAGPLLLAIGAIARILSLAVLGFNLLVKPIVLLVGFLPKIIAAFRVLGVVMAANPIGAFITATSLIIIYWKEIVGLFEKAFSWLSKMNLSGVWSKFKDFTGLGGEDTVVTNAQTAVASGPQSTPANFNNQRTVNNSLTVNIPPGMGASDALGLKNAVKQALQEENRQSYIELGAQ
jgi:tape measure domain-containing protein